MNGYLPSNYQRLAPYLTWTGSFSSFPPTTRATIPAPITTNMLTDISSIYSGAAQPYPVSANQPVVANNLLNRILQMVKVPQTTSQTTVNKQNPSPELEAAAKAFVDKLNTLSSGMTSAYGGLQAAFDDVIRNLSNTYGSTASRSANQAALNALSAGLTPLEAGGEAQKALAAVLQDYFPQLAGVKAQQANVPVELQNALAQLESNLYLPFLQNVMAPYWEGVAGATQTVTSQIPQLPVLMELYSKLSSQSDPYKLMELALQQQRLAQEGQLGAAELGLRQQELMRQSALDPARLAIEQQRLALERLGLDRRSAEAAAELALRERLEGQNLASRLNEILLRGEIEQSLLLPQLLQRQQEAREQNLASRLNTILASILPSWASATFNNKGVQTEDLNKFYGDISAWLRTVGR
ncbi:MAG: hypothetical protein QXT73_01315 [Candidatus Methanomethylicaceae archaeon]